MLTKKAHLQLLSRYSLRLTRPSEATGETELDSHSSVNRTPLERDCYEKQSSAFQALQESAALKDILEQSWLSPK